MAREHLFRGFHECAGGDTVITLDGEKIRGKWVKGGYVHYDDVKDGVDYCNYIVARHNGEYFPFFEVIPETICEQLPYSDKKGYKVFESDIVKRDGAPLNLIVRFNEVLMRYCLNYYDSQREQEYFVCFLDKDVFEKIEVIGNAFENFELLEEKL